MYILIALVLSFCFIILHIIRRHNNYWKDKQVPYLKPKPLFGNYRNYILLKKTQAHVAQDICKKFPDAPYIGTFYGTEPALLVQDPEVIKHILTKDFFHFNCREVSMYTHKEILTTNMFFTYGDRWKVIRQNLTPIFSSAKIKNMFYLTKNCSVELERLIDEETALNSAVDVKDVTQRFTMDSIGSSAFGINTYTMTASSKPNPFKVIGDLIFDNSNFNGAKLVTRSMWPSIFYGLGFQLFPKDITNFFNELLTGVFKQRQYKPTERNDFVDLLLNLKKNENLTGDGIGNFNKDNGKCVVPVDDEFLVANCVLFFAAGYETSATTMAFTLFEMAQDVGVQNRAFEEIDDYLRRHNNELSYDTMTELPYLEACMLETLRLHPVIALLTREVYEDCILPTGLKVEKGLRVHIPIYHLHHSPAHFPEPGRFLPDRFLPQNKQNITPYTYLPFGEGPRICIGMRFAKMQVLAGLVTLLKKYRISLAEGMPRTVETDVRTIITQPIGKIMLKFDARPEWEGRVFEK